MRNPPGKMSAEIFHLVESGEREALAERLEAGETDLCARDESGRTALDLAALLGREEVVRLLTEKGAEVNLTNKSGYSSLHRSAAWGHVGCLRVLVGCGAEHQLKTRHKETPRDIAARYGQTRCVEYLDCVDATYQLTQAVKQARDTLSDTDRIAGKWGKDDKSKVTALCNEKSLWRDTNQDPSLASIQEQRRDFDQRFQPYLDKLTPPEA